MPGVLILEGMAQVGGIMAFYANPETINKKLLFFAGIDKARFRRPVVPGDQLITTVSVEKKFGDSTAVIAKSSVEGKTVAKGELMFGVRHEK